MEAVWRSGGRRIIRGVKKGEKGRDAAVLASAYPS